MLLTSRLLHTELGELLTAASETGICRISFPVEFSGGWFPWFDRFFSAVPKLGEHPWLVRLESELAGYFSGRVREFSLPLDLRGTEFQQKVWRRLLAIPYGGTVTYGELAREFGLKGGSRAIGSAVGSNPVPILVPCHRVVGSTGQLVGFAGGLDVKERLLEIEGSRMPFGSLG